MKIHPLVKEALTHWSQYRLAKLLNKPPITVSRWNNGAIPQYDTLKQIEKLLNGVKGNGHKPRLR